MKMIQWKDNFYDEFLNNPSKDTFYSFLHNNFGELDWVDFKGEWIHKGHLAKTLLAMANSHGGVIVFGVVENEDGSIIPNGLTKFEDKASIGNEVSKYISPNLDFEVLNFDYDNTIYPNAQNRKFQMVFVHDTPERLPFVSLAETTGLDKDIIYIRRDTKCEKATAEEIENIISRKI
ncbi:MAG: ATP-binding protein [Clostridia bacterium]|nr:ATP-binding protein [Clostridia bacterium]